MTSKKVDLDVLVVNFNTSGLLDEMFEKLSASNYDGKVRCLVVDNASDDDSVEYLRSHYPDVLLLENERNVGFGRANNQLLEFVESDFVLLLNTDAFVASDSLNNAMGFMLAREDCGVLGARLIGRNGDLQPSCRYSPTPLNMFFARTGLARFFPWCSQMDDMEWLHDEVRQCDWVPGCFYLVRKEVIDQVGLFDPRFFLYCEEVDHCKRVREAGWKVLFFPGAEVVHIGGESAKSSGALTDEGKQISELQVESELLYFRKHYGAAGVLAHLVLSIIGDIYIFLKSSLRGRKRTSRSVFEDSKQIWRLLEKTRWGLQPTR